MVEDHRSDPSRDEQPAEIGSESAESGQNHLVPGTVDDITLLGLFVFIESTGDEFFITNEERRYEIAACPPSQKGTGDIAAIILPEMKTLFEDKVPCFEYGPPFDGIGGLEVFRAQLSNLSYTRTAKRPYSTLSLH